MDSLPTRTESTDAAERERKIEFDFQPQPHTCQFCQANVVTLVEYETTWTTGFVAAVMCLFMGWMTCCCLPFLLPFLKEAVHRCPRCLNKVGSKARVTLPSPRDEVMTFSCGKCAVVLSRKYLFFALVVIGLVFLAFLRIQAVENRPVEYTDASWDDFISDCGQSTFRRNPVRASINFRDKYQDKTVTWEGKLIKVDQNQQSIMHRGSPILIIRMDPSDSGLGADIAMIATADHSSSISNLNPGDWVAFNATFISAGRDRQLHHMHAVSIEKSTTERASPEEALIQNMMGLRERLASNGGGVFFTIRVRRRAGENGPQIVSRAFSSSNMLESNRPSGVKVTVSEPPPAHRHTDGEGHGDAVKATPSTSEMAAPTEVVQTPSSTESGEQNVKSDS
eukprot:GILK01010267.1.p1 GENE.GILK01010267.1~~GILK01010267.1.p1  ORF type:complete len:394 (-),score=47.22 GILK01010267.1:22-1203(-)